jgi:hypothetical protein
VGTKEKHSIYHIYSKRFWVPLLGFELGTQFSNFLSIVYITIDNFILFGLKNCQVEKSDQLDMIVHDHW